MALHCPSPSAEYEIAMQISISGHQRTRRKLADLGKLNATVVRGARRRATRSGRARATRDIALVLNLRSGRIRQQLRDTADELAVVGQERERPLTLGSFRGKFHFHGRRSAGYSVTIWKGLGRQYIKPAFNIPNRDVPFIRTGPTRDASIRPLYGPRIGVVFNRIYVPVRDFMRDRLVTEWKRAIRGRLARK